MSLWSVEEDPVTGGMTGQDRQSRLWVVENKSLAFGHLPDWNAPRCLLDTSREESLNASIHGSREQAG